MVEILDTAGTENLRGVMLPQVELLPPHFSTDSHVKIRCHGMCHVRSGQVSSVWSDRVRSPVSPLKTDQVRSGQVVEETFWLLEPGVRTSQNYFENTRSSLAKLTLLPVLPCGLNLHLCLFHLQPLLF